MGYVNLWPLKSSLLIFHLTAVGLKHMLIIIKKRRAFFCFIYISGNKSMDFFLNPSSIKKKEEKKSKQTNDKRKKLSFDQREMLDKDNFLTITDDSLHKGFQLTHN